MRKSLVVIAAVLSAVMLTACLADTSEAETAAQEAQENEKEETQQSDEEDYGSLGALAGEDFTLEEMLEYAIQDEYLARQEYESIMEEYGEQTPFSNIIKSEETHIAWLKELYEAYGLEVPEDNAIDYLVMPESLDVAYDLGVQAEINNIEMYEKFLEQDLPDDVRAVFTELRDASENHLAAFEKGTRGRGAGNN